VILLGAPLLPAVVAAVTVALALRAGLIFGVAVAIILTLGALALAVASLDRRRIAWLAGACSSNEALTPTNPTPDAMLAQGKELAQAGDFSAAFLVWRRAAEAGNAPAQVELAAFFDPLVTPSKGGFTPDGARAADWYERAALAGNAEAQRKFGLLLAKGGAGLPADQGRARSWLQQAAAQNDAEAKKALETLPK